MITIQRDVFQVLEKTFLCYKSRKGLLKRFLSQKDREKFINANFLRQILGEKRNQVARYRKKLV